MTTKKERLHFSSDRLQAIIELHPKSIHQISESTGISRTVIHKWMNGAWVPKLQNILTMCDYFEIEIGYFFPTGKKLKPQRSKPEPALV